MPSRRPDSAGPMTVPTCMMICEKAEAAGMWRGSTSAGTEAVRAVEENPVKPAATELTTYSATSDGCWTEALTARIVLVHIMAKVVHSMILRRSTESPIGPAANEPMTSGISCARLMAPTWRDEPVNL